MLQLSFGVMFDLLVFMSIFQAPVGKRVGLGSLHFPPPELEIGGVYFS